jgi:hypothetical protein
MTALGDARGAVAAALAGLQVPVHEQPPQTVQPPCVVVLPGSPWIAPRGHVTLDVVAYANPAGGNATALTVLEQLVENIRAALYAAGLAPGDTDTPRTEIDAGVLSARTPTTLRTTCH